MGLHTGSLPVDYRPEDSLDVTSPAARLQLVGLAAALSVATAHALLHVAPALRSDWSELRPRAVELLAAAAPALSGVTGIVAAVLGVGAMLGALAVIVLLHELVHGLAFWILTRVRPEFGLVPGYAFCGAPPGSFLPRDRFIVVALAPLLVLSLAGLWLMAWVPLLLAPVVGVYLVAHTAGAAADLASVGWLLRRSRSVYVWDPGPTLIVYAPA